MSQANMHQHTYNLTKHKGENRLELKPDMSDFMADHKLKLTEEDLQYVLREQKNASDLQEFLQHKIDEFEGKG